MKNNEQRNVGCFGIASYVLIGFAVLSFVLNIVQRPILNEYPDHNSFGNLIDFTLITLGVGIVLFIIDKIIKR